VAVRVVLAALVLVKAKEAQISVHVSLQR